MTSGTCLFFPIRRVMPEALFFPRSFQGLGLNDSSYWAPIPAGVRVRLAGAVGVEGAAVGLSA